MMLNLLVYTRTVEENNMTHLSHATASANFSKNIVISLRMMLM